ncbi:hypothetical protein IEQ34_006752 [Dendrobium chrysotoxum]|uniref:Uncharacterized protein n=1 Tax=Dendrobium chrysotoxum TaxID=161865 RepID=A0AAV7H4J2_DENCH|nr:hypothetical protein IEQ34_006752 [Dendrobium chrysotoxum]
MSGEKFLVAATMSVYVKAVISRWKTLIGELEGFEVDLGGGVASCSVEELDCLKLSSSRIDESDSETEIIETGSTADRLLRQMMKKMRPRKKMSAVKEMKAQKETIFAVERWGVARDPPIRVGRGGDADVENEMSGSPMKELLPKVVIWPVIGIIPCKRGLKETLNLLRSERPFRLEGKSPEKLLRDRSKNWRHRSLPSSGGMGPEKLLLEALSMTRGSNPMAGGSSPDILLFAMLRMLSSCIRPISDGNTPESRLPESWRYPELSRVRIGFETFKQTEKMPWPLRSRSQSALHVRRFKTE